MDVSRDDELPPPPPVPTGYYYAAHPGYAQAMYMPDMSMMSTYGYPLATIPQAPPQFADHTDIMSIIPTLRCWSCNKCGNLNYAHRLTCNLRKCQKMSAEYGAAEADWLCACGNVNYRFRKYCNMRKCQLPQIGNPYLFFGIGQLIKLGYSSQTALSMLLTNSGVTLEATSSQATSEPASREGCWQCTGCGNLNWPWRDSCNRKGCNQKNVYPS